MMINHSECSWDVSPDLLEKTIVSLPSPCRSEGVEGLHRSDANEGCHSFWTVMYSIYEVTINWPVIMNWSYMQWSSTIQTLIKELSNHPSWLQSQAPEVRRFGFQSSHLRSPAIVRPVGMVLYHPKMPGVVGSTNQTYPLKELYNRNTTNHSERRLLDPSISPNLHISIMFIYKKPSCFMKGIY